MSIASVEIEVPFAGITAVDVVIYSGICPSSSGGGGSSAYADLTDAATVDLPVVNTPLLNALAGKQAAGTYATGSGSASGTNTGDETAARIATALNAGTQDAVAADTDRLAVTTPAGGWMLLSTLWAWVLAKITANQSATRTALGGGVAGQAVFGAETYTGTGSVRKLAGIDSTDAVAFQALTLSGQLGVGNAAPVSRLDLAETWNRILTVTGASGNGTTATITFAGQATVIPVGARITAASINPSGYNGTFTVTASTLTSVSYANATTTAYVSGGTVSQIYTAIRANVTDTNSDANSLLMDLQVAGVSSFRVTKTGIIYFGSGTNNFFVPNLFGGISSYVGSSLVFHTSPTAACVGSNGGFAWSSTVTAGQSTEVGIYRDAANTLAQRNGTNAQTSRIYGTFTARGSGTTNLEALEIKGQASGAFIIQSLKGSAGGSAENIEFRHGATDTNGTITNGTLIAIITSTGMLFEGTSNFTTRPLCSDVGAVQPTSLITRADGDARYLTSSSVLTALGIPSYANLTAANTALAIGSPYYDTTLAKLQITTA